MMKNGVYFNIAIAFLIAELFRISIYANQMTCDVTLWTQSGVKSQKIEYLAQLFLYRAESYSSYTHHKTLSSTICPL